MLLCTSVAPAKAGA